MAHGRRTGRQTASSNVSTTSSDHRPSTLAARRTFRDASGHDLACVSAKRRLREVPELSDAGGEAAERGELLLLTSGTLTSSSSMAGEGGGVWTGAIPLPDSRPSRGPLTPASRRCNYHALDYTSEGHGSRASPGRNASLEHS